MKTILLYAWGVFLATVAGVATSVGIAMIFGEINSLVIYVARALPASVVPNPEVSKPEVSIAGSAILGFAVTLWTFERWRHRQHQINEERNS